jgi:hypothetical protein
VDNVRAISLTRPWPYTILHLGKRIENRSDKRGMPPMCRHRGPLLLHAAQSWDSIGCRLSEGGLIHHDRLLDVFNDDARNPALGIHPTGIVGRCNVVGHVSRGRGCGACRGEGCRWCGHRGFAPAWHDVAVPVDGGPDLRWWFGSYALVLDDVVAFDEPIPCRGALGLWRPPADVLAQLGERP